MGGGSRGTRKILICILFILLSRRKLNALDGLVIGAAVASGFAFIETTQYGYVHGLTTMEARNFWTLFSNHLLFTTPVLGALGLAANGEKLKLRHFLNWRVILCLALGMGCHALNNVSKEYLPISYWFLTVTILTIGDYPLFMSQLIVAVVEWTALLLVLRGGIRQALAASERGKTMAYMEHYGKSTRRKCLTRRIRRCSAGRRVHSAGKSCVCRETSRFRWGGRHPASWCLHPSRSAGSTARCG